MNNDAKYLQGINFLQLTLAEKAEIKNLGNETPDLIISQSSASRKQTYMRKFNPTIHMFNISTRVAVLKETLFCFLCLMFRGDTTQKETEVTDLKHVGEKLKGMGILHST